MLRTPCARVFLFCLMAFGQTTLGQPAPEFRGVWIATVDNIDWPSGNQLHADSQRAEFIRLLNFHQANGLNAVVVQIRPCTDAFYPSSYEPWSAWLTGRQGQPPAPYYDPLAFMITETHKRNMSFHAWFNPYRAEFDAGANATSANHITRLHPDWFVTYGNKRYFDPGIPEGQAYVAEVVADVVRRYPIDAVHFDDYFYPYKIDNVEFPDQASFRRYGAGRSKADWRRSNTDSIIARISRTIRAINPRCRFGISPFGVWRNKSQDPLMGSNTHGAQSNYDDLYADILKWLRNDWIDYVAPQLYWERGHRRAPFETLLQWWAANSQGKHCYIGLGMYKANSNSHWKNPEELPRQIEAIRQTPGVQGMIFFSSKSMVQNPLGWTDILRLRYFQEPAPLPAFE